MEPLVARRLVLHQLGSLENRPCYLPVEQRHFVRAPQIAADVQRLEESQHVRLRRKRLTRIGAEHVQPFSPSVKSRRVGQKRSPAPVCYIACDLDRGHNRRGSQTLMVLTVFRVPQPPHRCPTIWSLTLVGVRVISHRNPYHTRP